MDADVVPASERKAWRHVLPVLLAAAALVLSAGGNDAAATGLVAASLEEICPMKIRIVVDGESASAVLEDSAAGRDFAALLPLSLNLVDYARIERIADLPRRLSLAGAPDGIAAKAGDIAYYAPWGNLAIFIDDGTPARGLVRLGRIESGLPLLRKSGPFTARIERVVD